jgi:4-hydroxy-2-oxoglutarate aldolase
MIPLCTPFVGDGELSCDALRENIAKYNRAGVAGFVAAGSTGEAAFLSREEKLKLFETVCDAGDGKVLIAGAGVESVRETLRLIDDAARLGYDGALVLTPHYYRGQMARPETQLGFFRAVADSSHLPVLIYNFPQTTGIDLPLEVVAQLSEHSNIVGIKESSTDLERVRSLTCVLPKGFPVLVGTSAKFHECLCLGATGGILAIANAAPCSTQLVYDRYRSGDIQGSCDAQRRIAEAAGVAPRFGIQGLKYAMDLKGYLGGAARLPLLPLDEQQKAEIEALFRNIEG